MSYNLNNLCNLVNVLPRQGLAVTFPSFVAAEDNRCYVCFRAFNTIDEVDEPPCLAMRLLPCGHLIGDKCFDKLPKHQRVKCQLCRRPVERADLVTPWLYSLLQMQHLGAIFPAGLIKDVSQNFICAEDGLEEERILQVRLFAGLCTEDEGYLLWRLYLRYGYRHLFTLLMDQAMRTLLVFAARAQLDRLLTSWNAPSLLRYLLGHSGTLSDLLLFATIPLVFATISLVFVYVRDKGQLTQVQSRAVAHVTNAVQLELLIEHSVLFLDAAGRWVGISGSACMLGIMLSMIAGHFILYVYIAGKLISLGCKHKQRPTPSPHRPDLTHGISRRTAHGR